MASNPHTLSRITARAAALNALTAQAAEVVRGLEKELAAVGLPASVPMNYAAERLVFGRTDSGAFRISVVTETGQLPWSDCPRVVKIKAVSYLPALMTEIDKALAAVELKAARRVVRLLGGELPATQDPAAPPAGA